MQTSVVDYQDFSIEVLSQYLVAKDWKNIWSYLGSFINSFSPPRNQRGLVEMQKAIMLNSDEGAAYIQELASLIGEITLSLICDPECRISDNQFIDLVNNIETLHILFSLRQINTDGLVEKLINGKKKISINDQKKILLLLGLETNLDIVSIFKKIDSRFRVPALISYFGYSAIYSKNAYNNKIALYELKQEIEKNINSWLPMAKFTDPYFLCSYLNTENKHDLKRNINNGIQRYLKNQKDILVSSRKILKGSGQLSQQNRPRVMVVMEYISIDHSMVRSWGQWIKSLESEFEVFVIAAAKQRNPESDNYFSNIYYVQGFMNALEIAQEILPDLVIYPSVGMTPWVIFLSNLRLAPIQMMALGHPATTNSDCLDYVYGQSDLYDPKAFPNDTYIIDDSEYQFSAHDVVADMIKSESLLCNLDKKSSLKVSIIGSESKITYPFINLLQEIEAESEFNIEFNFYISALTINAINMQHKLEKSFRHFNFIGWQPYEKYMQAIKSADIVLNPFPFGHTNTIIDTLLLGKPCIGLEGIDPAAKTEKYILKTVGLDHLFLAKDQQDYKNIFKKLSKRILDGNIEFYDRQKIHNTLYSEKAGVDFGKNIKWIYDNHRKIQNLSRKNYTIYESL